MMSKRFAVMGNPISHSLSPLIHQQFAQQLGINLSYEKIEVPPDEFKQQVTQFFNLGGTGLNVTLPFKEEAYKLAAVHTERCAKAKAANTLWIGQDILHADNTDGAGLVNDVSHYLDLQGKKVLILGAGGAVRGILAPLFAAKIASMTVTNRTAARVEELQKDFPQIQFEPLENLSGDYDLVIHATSAGTLQSTINWPEVILQSSPFCYDLSYKASGLTAFVDWATQKKCRAVDGLGMLVEQAAEAFYIWHGVRPETKSVLRVLRQGSPQKL